MKLLYLDLKESSLGTNGGAVNVLEVSRNWRSAATR